jgi:hypothetical protein
MFAKRQMICIAQEGKNEAHSFLQHSREKWYLNPSFHVKRVTH